VPSSYATHIPPQQQDRSPGHTAPMHPKPDHGEESYRGSDGLLGKIVVITRGDSGIGRAVAIAFAREGATRSGLALRDRGSDD
jgi:hypothetical protein